MRWSLAKPHPGTVSHGCAPVPNASCSRCGTRGGWGDPIERNAEAVRRDVLDELVSQEAARNVYNVVLSADLSVVDYDATNRALSEQRFTTKKLEEITPWDISWQERLSAQDMSVSRQSSPYKPQ